MSNRQSTVGVPGANIGDQSRSCETRSCLFLCPCSGVDICTDTHTEYSTQCCFCITLEIQRVCTSFPSHTEVARRAVLKTDYHDIYNYCCTDTGVPGANIGDRSRACKTRSCLFLYPCIGVDICTGIHLNTVHTVLFLYHC